MFYAFRSLPDSKFAQAGGKGGTLAKLARRGYPVPDGFILLPDAFTGDDLKPDAWDLLQKTLTEWSIDSTRRSFAVRSSALSEDSAQASFAGEFETVLDVKTDEALHEAIRTVQRSRENARVKAYSAAQGMDDQHEIAVVVQQFIRAELSGVLFTADPVTGDLNHMVGNYVRGVGEALVSGQANARTFSLDVLRGAYDGPAELRPYARQLYRLAKHLDADLDAPQDIEWAVAGGKVYILQSRPITTLRAFNPQTGEWNDSLTGDFLWSNGNAAEIQPNVQTLLAWSVGHLWGRGYSQWWAPRYEMGGFICGRNYFNLTVQVAPFVRLPWLSLDGAMRFIEVWWGRVPKGVTIPLMPFTRWDVLTRVLPIFFGGQRRIVRYQSQIPEFVAKNPQWCRDMRQRIAQITDRKALAALWRDEIQPYFCFGTMMGGAANGDMQTRLEKDLRKLVGEEDASAIVSNLGGDSHLESLGPLVGLYKVSRGEMSREECLERYGHRAPDEFNLATPQPVEDPAWLDKQLADFAQSPIDVPAILDKQRARFNAAWERFSTRYPQKVTTIRRRLDKAAQLARLREAGRSETTRIMGVTRAWALRAGELTGLGDEVYHLLLTELLDVLDGDERLIRTLPKRRETYEKYCALPTYPPVISGRFDPFQWAADPNRRSDVYDSHIAPPLPEDSNVLSGFAGSAGTVEGFVRRLDRTEDGHCLQPGEILVTTATNIGWTPLFPRAAAIVTDVGAPLSHAAIVARELGIPAVVGCREATAKLHNGDRIRVNGGQGTVEILARA